MKSLYRSIIPIVLAVVPYVQGCGGEDELEKLDPCPTGLASLGTVDDKISALCCGSQDRDDQFNLQRGARDYMVKTIVDRVRDRGIDFDNTDFRPELFDFRTVSKDGLVCGQALYPIDQFEEDLRGEIIEQISHDQRYQP